MAEILLSSEMFVKSQTSASDNLAGKYILPSLREAQEIGLRAIIGDALLDKLKALVADRGIDEAENAAYKALLGYVQYYLAYQTLVEVTYKSSYKLGNFGVTKTTDENLQVATRDEIVQIQAYYQSKADYYCAYLQGYCLANRASLPELNDCTCYRISANLQSAASCGVFLGGARGKKIY